MTDFRELPEYRLMLKFIKRKVNIKALSFMLISVLVVMAINNLFQLGLSRYERLHEKSRDEDYTQIAEWLKANTKLGDIVFYDDWSYWPQMFYRNDYNRYVTGVDPTFLYEYDNELYWYWRNISIKAYACNKEERCADLTPRESLESIPVVIKEKFNAQYVMLKNDQELPLTRVMRLDKTRYLPVFENESFLLFRVK